MIIAIVVLSWLLACAWWTVYVFWMDNKELLSACKTYKGVAEDAVLSLNRTIARLENSRDAAMLEVASYEISTLESLSRIINGKAKA